MVTKLAIKFEKPFNKRPPNRRKWKHHRCQAAAFWARFCSGFLAAEIPKARISGPQANTSYFELYHRATAVSYCGSCVRSTLELTLIQSNPKITVYEVQNGCVLLVYQDIEIDPKTHARPRNVLQRRTPLTFHNNRKQWMGKRVSHKAAEIPVFVLKSPVASPPKAAARCYSWAAALIIAQFWNKKVSTAVYTARGYYINTWGKLSQRGSRS